jgi:hypothetical protein
MAFLYWHFRAQEPSRQHAKRMTRWEQCARCTMPGWIFRLLLISRLLLDVEADVRFKNLMAPSRHSGLSSLSPKLPRSSDTRMSAWAGTSSSRISPKRISTRSCHSSAFFSCSLVVRRDRHTWIKRFSRDVGADVLFDGKDACTSTGPFHRAQGAVYQWTSARSDHRYHAVM